MKMKNNRCPISNKELETSFLDDLKRVHYSNRGKNLKNYLESRGNEKIDLSKTEFFPEENTLLIKDKKYFNTFSEMFGLKKFEVNGLSYEILVPETNDFVEEKIIIKYGSRRK